MSAPRDKMIEVRDVSVTFGGVTALNAVSFDVAAGEICGLIGPNGAGKTTLFNCISRLYQPTGGQIVINGRDILALRRDQIADAGVARTFQHVGLFPSLSVFENILTGSHHRARGGWAAAMLGLPSMRKNEILQRSRADALVDLFGLGDVARLPAEGLSIGTLKRIELARAMMGAPCVLILDEPANGLVHEEVMQLAELVTSLAGEEQLSVLVVEHHMGMVMSMSHKVVVLNFGNVIADGLPTDVAADPAVIEAYLGGAA